MAHTGNYLGFSGANPIHHQKAVNKDLIDRCFKTCINVGIHDEEKKLNRPLRYIPCHMQNFKTRTLVIFPRSCPVKFF